jgi:hypothetical protein
MKNKVKKVVKAGSVENIAKLVEKIHITKEEIVVKTVEYPRFLKISGSENECMSKIAEIKKTHNVSIVGLVNITDIKTYSLELEPRK